jgi:hypothetical protein
MKTGANTSEWYLVLGSGPTALDGTSTQEAKTAVFSLKELTASPRAAFQIPDTVPTAGNETGRFFHADDKTDAGSNAQETYYGIKEPQNCGGDMTWFPVKKNPALPTTTPGDRGLLQVDQILVQESSATLSCIGGGDACLRWWPGLKSALSINWSITLWVPDVMRKCQPEWMDGTKSFPQTGKGIWARRPCWAVY